MSIMLLDLPYIPTDVVAALERGHLLGPEEAAICRVCFSLLRFRRFIDEGQQRRPRGQRLELLRDGRRILVTRDDDVVLSADEYLRHRICGGDGHRLVARPLQHLFELRNPVAGPARRVDQNR